MSYELTEQYEEEFEQDNCDTYDVWREEWANMLDEAVSDLADAFVNCKERGYYKQHPARFVDHVLDTLERDLNVKVTTDGNGVRWVK